ncbi:MAG: hypothetical protein AB7O88_10885 [Reyranellaceae bacterium]
MDPQTGYLNLRGQEVLQQAPAVLDAYSEAQTRTLDAAADDDQRRMLQELADKRLASFNEVVERHGAAQRQSWYDQVGDHRIAAMNADAALHWNSDALLRRALGTARAEVRERAERKGWDSPLTEAALSRETSRILVSAIGAAVDHDPERARSLRTRYAAVIEDADRAALDALLAEAQIRERAQAASTEILNATPPEGHHPTPQWRMQHADALTDPAVRAAAIRRLASAAAASEARARTMGEQVLARVLKGGLTDPSQIPVGEWVALDPERRQAIESRLDHNAASTDPAPNRVLVDELAAQMTQAPHDFARRDLVPLIAQLSLPQWQRSRDWQAGLRRNDPTTEDVVYAIRRGLQFIAKMLMSNDAAATCRAELLGEIDTWHKINGKSPDDAAMHAMAERHVLAGSSHNIGPAPGSTFDLQHIDKAFNDLADQTQNVHQTIHGVVGPLVNLLRLLIQILKKRPPKPLPVPPPAPAPSPSPKVKSPPKPPKVFLPPTNPPQHPPSQLPPGHTIRYEPAKPGYPHGYWRQYNARRQPIDISTGKPPANVTKPEFEARTHVPLPPP